MGLPLATDQCDVKRNQHGVVDRGMDLHSKGAEASAYRDDDRCSGGIGGVSQLLFDVSYDAAPACGRCVYPIHS